MRLEVKSRESSFIKKLGIETFDSLLERTTYKCLAESILKEWQTTLIFDFNEVETKEKHTTEYWLDAINKKRRNTFTNRKKSYFKNLPSSSIISRIEKLLKNGHNQYINEG